MNGTKPPSATKGQPLPNWDDLILLGHITRTQGHRGALRLHPEFDPVDQIEGLKATN